MATNFQIIVGNATEPTVQWTKLKQTIAAKLATHDMAFRGASGSQDFVEQNIERCLEDNFKLAQDGEIVLKHNEKDYRSIDSAAAIAKQINSMLKQEPNPETEGDEYRSIGRLFPEEISQNIVNAAELKVQQEKTSETVLNTVMKDTIALLNERINKGKANINTHGRHDARPAAIDTLNNIMHDIERGHMDEMGLSKADQVARLHDALKGVQDAAHAHHNSEGARSKMPFLSRFEKFVGTSDLEKGVNKIIDGIANAYGGSGNVPKAPAPTKLGSGEHVSMLKPKDEQLRSRSPSPGGSNQGK